MRAGEHLRPTVPGSKSSATLLPATSTCMAKSLRSFLILFRMETEWRSRPSLRRTRHDGRCGYRSRFSLASETGSRQPPENWRSPSWHGLEATTLPVAVGKKPRLLSLLSLSFSSASSAISFDQMGLKTRAEAVRRANPGTGMKTVPASAKFREALFRQEGQGIFETSENPLRLQKTQGRGTLKEH